MEILSALTTFLHNYVALKFKYISVNELCDVE